MLGLVRQVLFGAPADRHREVPEDLHRRERLLLAPILAAYFVLGVFPRLLVDRLDPTVTRWVADLRIERTGQPATAPPAVRPKATPQAPHPGEEREY
jgi:NADH-quinone oxidoreductase subunit M